VVQGLDIGPDSLKAFQASLRDCKTVIWNGPMGVFEYEKFAKGTFGVAETLAGGFSPQVFMVPSATPEQVLLGKEFLVCMVGGSFDVYGPPSLFPQRMCSIEIDKGCFTLQGVCLRQPSFAARRCSIAMVAPHIFSRPSSPEPPARVVRWAPRRAPAAACLLANAQSCGRQSRCHR